MLTGGAAPLLRKAKAVYDNEERMQHLTLAEAVVVSTGN